MNQKNDIWLLRPYLNSVKIDHNRRILFGPFTYLQVTTPNGQSLAEFSLQTKKGEETGNRR